MAHRIASSVIVAALLVGVGSSALGQYDAKVLYKVSAPPESTFIAISTSPQTVDGLQIVGWERIQGGGADPHALLWTSNGKTVDLHPTRLTGFIASTANGTNGVQQVGRATLADHVTSHAILWNGTADSAVDLAPSQLKEFTNTGASGTDGVHQFGDGQITGVNAAYHALLWSGTPDSAVDLNPAGFTDSFAFGLMANQQVGSGWTAAGGKNRDFALMWSGTAASAVELHPIQMPQILQSFAYATDGRHQVGVGYGIGPSGNYYHAFLWSGTAESAVDLNPTNLKGITHSYAYGVYGSQQVGYGYSGFPLPGPDVPLHALLWNGTADSAVDLQSALPPTFVSSKAYNLDASGDVFGVASDSQFLYAVEWVAIPEPAVLSVAIVGMTALTRRRWTSP